MTTQRKRTRTRIINMHHSIRILRIFSSTFSFKNFVIYNKILERKFVAKNPQNPNSLNDAYF